MATKKRNNPDIKASRSSQRKTGMGLADAVRKVDTESEWVALNQWEQLWKDTLRKNEDAVSKERRKIRRF